MDIEKEKNIVCMQPGLSTTLGMEFISTPEPDTCMTRMRRAHIVWMIQSVQFTICHIILLKSFYCVDYGYKVKSIS